MQTPVRPTTGEGDRVPLREQCPVCDRSFDRDVINKHVDSCLWLHEKRNLSKKSPRTKETEQQKQNTVANSGPMDHIAMKRKRNGSSGGVLKSFFSSSTDGDTSGSSSIMKKQCTEVSHDKRQQQLLDCSGSDQDVVCTDVQKSINATKKHTISSNSNTNIVVSQTTGRATTVLKSQPSKLDDGPLAEKMRPDSLMEYIGQQQLLGDGSVLRTLIQSDDIPSMILWGPPGCGKTTLAHIIGRNMKVKGDAKFVQLSATNSGVADVRKVVLNATNDRKLLKVKTILFIDEIHRFNKTQQDSFLPHVEKGTITLIGATTENPSFHLNSALLSRCKVYPLEKLTVENLIDIIVRAARQVGVRVLVDGDSDTGNSSTDEPSYRLSVYRQTVETLAELCDGDARIALNGFHTAVKLQKHKCQQSPADVTIDISTVKESLLKTHLLYDRVGDEHHNCASALQKSIRGSCASAAVYWLARMLSGGEDPMFVARRLVVCASEDIGLADPHALPLAVGTMQACQLVGMPECRINLAHCTAYLAQAPKSNTAYMAYNKAIKCIEEHKGAQPGVPLHLRNAPTRLTKQLGYGEGYIYTHGQNSNATQQYLPEGYQNSDFFEDL